MRVPTAKGGVGLCGSGAGAEAAGFVAAVELAPTVEFLVTGLGREAVEFDPPHAVTTIAITTAKAATPRRRDVGWADVAAGGGMALRWPIRRCKQLFLRRCELTM
jgi:hypothetical protein